MWLVIILLALLFLLTLYVDFVTRRYPLGDRAEKIVVTTSDGWKLCAWYRPAPVRRFSVPVVLCHGLANSHAFMEFRGERNLAKHLSAAGFDCYSIDLRGAGETEGPEGGTETATFDDHLRLDVPALVDEICRRSGQTQVAWVGHSLGGLLGLAGQSTPLRERFAVMVTVGSPVFLKLSPRMRWALSAARRLGVGGRLNLGLVRWAAPFAGYFSPAQLSSTNLGNIDGADQRFLLANVFAPVWVGVLGQLEDWAATNSFRSLDKQIDYRAGIGNLAVPTLVIGGTRDFLCPPQATREYFDLVKAPRRELLMLGTEQGYEQAYGHGDLLIGRRAQLDVYPVIERFLASALATSAELPAKEVTAPS